MTLPKYKLFQRKLNLCVRIRKNDNAVNKSKRIEMISQEPGSTTTSQTTPITIKSIFCVNQQPRTQRMQESKDRFFTNTDECSNGDSFIEERSVDLAFRIDDKSNTLRQKESGDNKSLNISRYYSNVLEESEKIPEYILIPDFDLKGH